MTQPPNDQQPPLDFTKAPVVQAQPGLPSPSAPAPAVAPVQPQYSYGAQAPQQYPPQPYPAQPYPPQHYAPQGYPQQQYGPRTIGQKRSAWGVWWLCMLTFGIYYCVWYYKINEELRQFAPHAVKVDPTLAMLSQFVPIAGLVSIANTAGRVAAAHASIGSSANISGGMAVLSAFWFSSQPRYLQRRLNSLWDTAATLHVHGR